ncbi:MAG TPA: sugar phosphate nucleotidyltransferase [Chloroflexota bacterium]|nr:sugar phosphate nucleotidyltransferase [Chloroflexota bacterium]
MKVVLFCGGQGLRMRDVSDTVPKPMVPIGDRPLLLHVMKYYAHYGHTDFILCLGYKARVIKEYFLNYREAFVNDFVFSDGGRTLELLRSDLQEWRITFVDTGLQANIGQRLKAVQPLLAEEEVFLANYADGLTDAPLPAMIAALEDAGKIAGFLCVKPTSSFHVVRLGEDNVVQEICPLARSDTWINAGYFVFRNEIFDYIHEGEELVEQPFQRLIAQRQLLANRYEGFWTAMDTYKDQQLLESLYHSGLPPWAVWEQRGQAVCPPEADAV